MHAQSNPRSPRSIPRCAAGVRVEALESRIQLTALPAGFGETVVGANLGFTTAMDVLPDGRVLVSSQAGDLFVVKNGATLPTPFIHLDVDSIGERGLLGVAHDPHFSTNHFIYLYHTVPATVSAAPHNEVTRYTADGDVAGSAVDILQLTDLSGATNHNGGGLHFGTDGMLYVSAGENANPVNSQTLSNLLGKVLRIDVSTIQPGDPVNDVAKIIPQDNPFVGTATGINQAIYALGFRNPFTFVVQPTTGTIFVDDVGENTWEEIDKLVPGGNYGWNFSEGFAPTVPPAGIGPGVYQDPLLAYNHQGGPAGGGMGIIGGAFYDPPAGAAHPFPASYDNKYFYADLGSDWIRTFDPAHPGSLVNPDTSSGFATGTASTPVALALAPDGGIYYLARGNGGELLEISAATVPLPVITITGGLVNGNFDAGTPITFSLAASDSQDGALSAKHFTCHVDYITALNHTRAGIVHPLLPAAHGKALGAFTPKVKGAYTGTDVLYRITFKVTARNGATAKTTLAILPNTSTLAFQSMPLGISLRVDGHRQAAPVSIDSVVGFTHLVAAPKKLNSGGSKGAFVSWSDGGRASHRIAAPEAGMTLTAVYAFVLQSQKERAASGFLHLSANHFD